MCFELSCTAYITYHFYNRKIRQRDASKFRIQMCVAMLLMLLVFTVGVERTENSIGCTISSVLIQYFTLASVFWMGAEAVLMFKKLIIVFGNVTTKFVVAISLICWGNKASVNALWTFLSLYSLLRCACYISCCWTNNISYWKQLPDT